MTTVSPARAAKTPLCDTWARNVGPLPLSGPPESFTASTRSDGMAARPTRRARVRSRPNDSFSSLSNIEALPGQRDEEILETWRLREEGPHPNAGADESGGDVLGGRAEQLGAHDG